MSHVETLVDKYKRQVGTPWPKNLPGAQRIWFVVYDKNDERRVRPRIDAFATVTHEQGHKWRSLDVTNLFADWMAAHDYREQYFADPEAMQMALADFGDAVAERLKEELTAPDVDDNTVVGVVGIGSLFGLVRVSGILPQVESDIRGRLAVFWPGTHSKGNYRLLDAHDGWNYHAIAISASDGI